MRKTDHADLEHKKSIFFEIGVIVSLGLVLFLMEVNFKSRTVGELVVDENIQIEQEIIPITRQQQDLPPPPPPVKIHASDIINIVDDDVILDEELEILDTETDEDQEVEVIEMPDIMPEEEASDEPIFIVVEEMPIFRPDICKTEEQGRLELLRYISTSIRYPIVAAENGIEGKVFVEFVVSPQGKVTNTRIIRGVHPALDEEAIRVVDNLPDFSPGLQRGKPVRVQYSVPIRFVLQ